MVPKVAGKGASFKGAALYYLHDKGALTDSRVLFALTENLPTDDPQLAVRVMINTAQRQDQLKAQAGISNRGRKLEQPVYTYSLSWAPDEAPTHGEMIGAARASLQALGLSGHETLLVAHNDEPHPHIHVIVNRVHPETGVAAKLSNDHLKLSKWAEAYERAQGLIRCERRVENNQRRQSEYVKDRESARASDFRKWRTKNLQDAFDDRQADKSALGAAHKAQREALFAAKEQRVRLEIKAIRERYDHRWHALYLSEQADHNKLSYKQFAAAKSLKGLLRDKPKRIRADRETRSGYLRPAFGVAAAGERKALRKRHRQERAKLASHISNQQRTALKRINDEYRRDLAKMKERQKQERDQLAKLQTDQMKLAAKAIKTGADKIEYQKDRLDKRRKDQRGATGAFDRAATDKKTPTPILTDEFSKTTGKGGTSKCGQHGPRVTRLHEKFRKAAEDKERAKQDDRKHDTGRSVGKNGKRGPKPD